jgi:hypothetical protein
MAQKITQFLLMISLGVAILFAAIAGVIYITSAGHEQMMSTAKQALTTVFVGFGLTLAAWLMVTVIGKLLGYDGNQSWYQFSLTCQYEIKSGSGLEVSPVVPFTYEYFGRETIQKCRECQTLRAPACHTGEYKDYCDSKCEPNGKMCSGLGVVETCDGCKGQYQEPCTQSQYCSWEVGGCLPNIDKCGDGYAEYKCSSCSLLSKPDCITPENRKYCEYKGRCIQKDSVCHTKDVSTCDPATSGYCQVEMLERNFPCFGSNARKASGICFGESNGVEDTVSGTDICKDGNAGSFGLFQINLTVHELPVRDNDGKIIKTLPCKDAFNGKLAGSTKIRSGPNAGKYDCEVINEPLYNECVVEAKKAKNNIPKACEISNGGMNWNQWGVNRICKY